MLEEKGYSNETV